MKSVSVTNNIVPIRKLDNTTREVNQVVDTDIGPVNSGTFKSGGLTWMLPLPNFTKSITFGPAMTAATHNLTLGAFSLLQITLYYNY